MDLTLPEASEGAPWQCTCAICEPDSIVLDIEDTEERCVEGTSKNDNVLVTRMISDLRLAVCCSLSRVIDVYSNILKWDLEFDFINYEGQVE